NCGQYRLVVAHREPNIQIRLHLIFEAVLPNPNPSAGIAACRPVAQFWSNLSQVDSMNERRARIEQFFFEGLPGFAPVIDPPNFANAGGVRTLQQSIDSAARNRFYQFRLVKDCVYDDCMLRFAPDVLENMPFGLLFDSRNTSAQAREFRAEFVKHVPTLAVNDLNLFFMNIPKKYLMAESNPIASTNAFIYSGAFDESKATVEGAAFSAQIQAELDRVGSPLTPDHIIERATHQSCFGCHGFNGAVPLGGGLRLEVSPVHFGNQFVSDDVFADGEAGPQTRYAVDPIIEKQFVPHRMKIVQDFLRDGTPPVHSN
ncbi:MAG TPA: hypothetical protein VN181_03840, partial [Thermoanaerobaculia bacterium]|nr:hypothetical protein [Thermoanaerobaculia bacterium]